MPHYTPLKDRYEYGFSTLQEVVGYASTKHEAFFNAGCLAHMFVPYVHDRMARYGAEQTWMLAGGLWTCTSFKQQRNGHTDIE